MINFKNFKQVKYSTFSAIADADKIGYMWLVRDEDNGMSYIYFGSRKYAEINDVTETTKIANLFNALGDAINENGEWVGFTESTDVIKTATNLSEAVSSLDSALNAKTGEINDAINEIKAQIAGVFHFKGVVDTVEALETIDAPQNGDVYRVGDSEYVYNGTEWVELGTPFNIAENSDFVALQERVSNNENALERIENTINALFIINGNDVESAIV